MMHKSSLIGHIPSTWSRVFSFSLDLIWSVPLMLVFLRSSILHYLHQGWMPLMAILLYICSLVLIEIFFLKFLGATPGKWIMGLRVVPFNMDSYRLKLTQCWVRVLSFRMLYFLFSLAPFVTLWLRYDRTHLVDWIADTRVISLRERRKRAVLRPLVASVLFVFFVIRGLEDAQNSILKIDFAKGRFHLPKVNLSFEVEEFQ